jgi:hypothetical protein
MRSAPLREIALGLDATSARIFAANFLQKFHGVFPPFICKGLRLHFV